MPTRKPAFIQLADHYFRFSRSQRRAMAIMVAVTALLMMLSFHASKVFRNEVNEPFVTAETLALLSGKDSGYATATWPQRQAAYPQPQRYQGADNRVTELTPDYFDPNTASEAELLALGLRPKVVQQWLNYRNKGGRFRKPEDLAKLYALKPEVAERLMPYVRMESSSERLPAQVPAELAEAPLARTVPARPRAEIAPVDINLADSITLQVLPGIGAKRASSILRYRERLGGFVSIAQVGETYGLPDSVFQQIKGSLTLGAARVEQLSLNTATEAQLKAHPYIGWQLAKIIVAYRQQHGAYKSVDDLLKIHIIKPDWLEKVRPYLSVQP